MKQETPINGRKREQNRQCKNINPKRKIKQNKTTKNQKKSKKKKPIN